jgi:predicted DNA-binding transcriptional regulator AlpA
MPERVRAADVANMTGMSKRTVLQHAAAGKIPGAAKLGGLWTFDPAAIRAWIRREEERAARRAAPAMTSSVASKGWSGSVLPDETIAARYAKLMSRKRPAIARKKSA